MAGSFFLPTPSADEFNPHSVALEFQSSSPPFPAAVHLIRSVPHNSSERYFYATLGENSISSLCFLQHSQPEQRSGGAGWEPDRKMRISELDHSLARGHHHLPPCP